MCVDEFLSSQHMRGSRLYFDNWRAEKGDTVFQKKGFSATQATILIREIHFECLLEVVKDSKIGKANPAKPLTIVS